MIGFSKKYFPYLVSGMSPPQCISVALHPALSPNRRKREGERVLEVIYPAIRLGSQSAILGKIIMSATTKKPKVI
jgi:hypothetical protein